MRQRTKPRQRYMSEEHKNKLRIRQQKWMLDNPDYVICNPEKTAATVAARDASWCSEAGSLARRGTGQHTAKLTEKIVWDIRHGHLKHIKSRSVNGVKNFIANTYGIYLARSNVNRMLLEISWKHVTENYYD